MKSSARFIGAALVALVLVACSSPAMDVSPPRGASCERQLDRVISLIRAGEKGNGHDTLSFAIEEFRLSDCSPQWQTFADYSSGRSTSGAFGEESCAELAGYLGPAAIRLLRQDGFCKGRISGGRTRAPAREAQPGGGISWDEASRHIGSRQRVCGPLAGTGQSADDVFLNLGVDYPDPNRFTVVLWDVGNLRPPPGVKVACVSGVITEYRGVAQIQLRSIEAVETYH